MSKKRSWLLALLLAVVIVGTYVGITYNNLLNKEENVKKFWADVERTYQRRHELIPSLVAVVSGMADYEKNTLTAITEARAKLNSINVTNSGQPPTPEVLQQQQQLQTEIATQANRLIAVIETYPNLRGTEGFLALQTQLERTEQRIKVARKDYNEAVEKYNVSVRKFPSNIVASVLGFTPKTTFAAETGAEKAIEIKFEK